MGNYQGNLVHNGGFELGLLSWECENVTCISGNPHTGLCSALLGTEAEQSASLVQNIKVSHNRCYLLSFFTSSKGNSGDLYIKVTWLDKKRHKIGMGIDFEIPGVSIASAPLWSYFVELSNNTPEECRYARICISKDGGEPVRMDDIIFYQQK